MKDIGTLNFQNQGHDNSSHDNAHDNPSHDNTKDNNGHDMPGKGSAGAQGGPDASQPHISFRESPFLFRADINGSQARSGSTPRADSPHESDYLSRFANFDHLSISREFAREAANSYDRVSDAGPLNELNDKQLAAIWRSFDEDRRSVWNVWEAITEHAPSEFHLLSRGGNGQRNDWAGLEIAWAAREQISAQARAGSYKYAGSGGRCNWFRADVAASLGLYTPMVDGRPMTTGEWANADRLQVGIRCYSRAPSPQDGSGYNFYDPSVTLGPTHHTGYVSDATRRQGVAAGSSTVSEYTTWSSDQTGANRYIQRRSDEQNLTGRAEMHFYDYNCPDHLPFERQRDQTP